MVRINLFFFLLLCNSAFAALNSPKGAILLNPKAYSINISEYAFGTTGYYNSNGEKLAMSSDSSFSLSDTDFKLNYTFIKNFETGLITRVRRVVSSTLVNNSAVNLDKFGLESLGINFKYKLNSNSNSHFAIGGSYRKTLYTNSQYSNLASVPTNEISLGDDGSEFTVDMYSTILFTQSRLDSKISYVSPPNKLSSEIDYDLNGTYFFGNFGLIAGLNGIYSLKNDEFTSVPSAKPQIARGSSTLFNSINREFYAGYLGASYDFNRKAVLEAKGGPTFGGKSTDKGLFGLISVSFNSSGETVESEKIESFKEYHIEGSVLKVSPRGNFVKIDQGLSTDVEKGMAFDIYQTDYFGGNVLVASGVVYEIGSDWSVIKLVKKYTNIEIKPGFAARGK